MNGRSPGIMKLHGLHVRRMDLRSSEIQSFLLIVRETGVSCYIFRGEIV
ncbi:hypothetical protein U27_01757 [Candidatus Vecturithrix granuli]|uniref:Uncharacterized protein n=1 Tax=Vecturithrix granuli TaxID=1499967 RepID=A0A0S6WB84_VECG1|nr:hypothetical protein U27_01757 [Candidatus Vecturithrix granuli]